MYGACTRQSLVTDKFNLINFFKVICSTIGCIIFFINANRPEIRYVQIPTSAERWKINEVI